MQAKTGFDREELIQAVKNYALSYGDFTLASGKKASYYLDCRLITLDSRTVSCVASGMLSQLARLSPEGWPDAIGGLAVGAVPITAAMLTQAAQQQQQLLRGFFVRKEVKGHGAGRQIEGPVMPGESVVIVEDVVTSGGSALQASDACQEFGLQVQGVLAIIDRLEGGRENLAARGLSLHTLLTVDDLDLPR